MMIWILVLVLLWPLLWVLRWILLTRMLLGMEFRRGVVRGVDPEQVSPHFREAALPWWRDLDAQRFRLLGGWTIDRHTDQALNDEAMVLVSEDGTIRAIVRPAPESSRSGECTLTLRTTTPEGHELVTCSYYSEALAPLPPAIHVEVQESPSAALLLGAHRERLKRSGVVPWACADLASAISREQHICDAEFALFARSGWVNVQADGTLSYRFLPALKRSAILLWEHARRKKSKPKGVPPPPAISDEALESCDYRHYRQLCALQAGRLSRRNKSILAVVSLLLFMGVLVYRDSPVAAAALLVALVFHEFGHLAGMWMFGYKDTQLLFIPFLGGAAVAHDDRILAPWKHVVILLLGPLPGLFLGLALALWNTAQGGPEWLSTVANTFIGLNVFNLAPIMPLDGGQLCDVAFASRFPRLRVIFMGVSGAALAWLGWTFDAASLLTGLGVLLLLGLPSQWRMAGLRRDVREDYPDGGDEETIARRVLRGMREPQWAKVAMAQRLSLVRGLQSDLRAPKPGLGTLAFAALGYTSPVWLGLPLVLALAYQANQAQLETAHAKAAAAGLIATAPAPAAPVPPETNAAVPYAKAVSLLTSNFERQVAEAGEIHGRAEAADQEVITLLRAAAQKAAFSPLPDPPASGLAAWFVREHGQVVTQLLTHGHERVRFGEGNVALSVAADVLRLNRLMQTAPGWLPWRTHLMLETGGWRLVEEALHAGAVPTPGQLTLLYALADNRVEIAFAASALPRSLLQLDPLVTEIEEETAPTDGMMASFLALSDTFTHARTASVDQAIAARDALQRIRRGEWPPLVHTDGDVGADSTEFAVSYALGALADVLAQQRQARAALRWSQRKDSAPPNLETLGVPAAELTHPVSGEPLEIVQRGSIHVLRFPAASSPQAAAEGLGQEIIWRLPAVRR